MENDKLTITQKVAIGMFMTSGALLGITIMKSIELGKMVVKYYKIKKDCKKIREKFLDKKEETES